MTRFLNPVAIFRPREIASGFTLVEILAALVIFSLAVVALIRGMGDAVRIQTDLVSRERAAMLAKNILEEMVYSRDVKIGSDEGQFEDEDAMFTWHSRTEATETANLYEVTVTVAWDEGRGPMEFPLTTFIFKPEKM
jgi:general secretion pathway protein I